LLARKHYRILFDTFAAHTNVGVILTY
jgi:hypothetical protein